MGYEEETDVGWVEDGRTPSKAYTLAQNTDYYGLFTIWYLRFDYDITHPYY